MRKFAVIALLLVLPLQGAAAVLSHLVCPAGEHPVALPHAHDHGGSNMDDPDGNLASDAGHSNCHYVFSGVATIPVPPAAFEPLFLESSISLLFTLFIPERPQRPPRT